MNWRLNDNESIYSLAPWRCSSDEDLWARTIQPPRPVVPDCKECHTWCSTDICLQSGVKQGARLAPTDVATAIQDEAPIDFERRHIENRRMNDGKVISRGIKSAVEEIGTKELSPMVEEWLDDTPGRFPLHRNPHVISRS